MQVKTSRIKPLELHISSTINRALLWNLIPCAKISTWNRFLASAQQLYVTIAISLFSYSTDGPVTVTFLGLACMHKQHSKGSGILMVLFFCCPLYKSKTCAWNSVWKHMRTFGDQSDFFTYPSSSFTYREAPRRHLKHQQQTHRHISISDTALPSLLLFCGSANSKDGYHEDGDGISSCVLWDGKCLRQSFGFLGKDCRCQLGFPGDCASSGGDAQQAHHERDRRERMYREGVVAVGRPSSTGVCVGCCQKHYSSSSSSPMNRYNQPNLTWLEIVDTNIWSLF